MSHDAPILRPYGRRLVPAPTGGEASAFDALAIEELGVPQPVLMENAGRSAAQVAARLFPEGPVVAFVGAGNNGGDALVLARTLAAWGRDVTAVLVADRPQPEPLLHGWAVPTVVDTELGEGAWTALLASAGLLVDGVLGTGVRGAPRARAAAAIGRLNAADCPVLAIDIPSGVDSGRGQVAGVAVQADLTVSFGAPKLGSLLHPGRAHVGRQVAVEIAFPPMREHRFSGQVVTPAWAQSQLPVRSTDTHKNAVGRVLVVAGSPGMAGAAVLAVRGALRAGAGLVQVCSPPENREILQSAVPEAIFVDGSDSEAVADALGLAGAVVVGPGLGTDDAAARVLAFMAEGPAVPTVLDADALTLLAAEGGAGLRDLSSTRPTLLTPHLGEMTRLTGAGADDIAADRVSAAEDASSAFGCAVLLKGAPSLVACGAEPVLVDTQSSSDLATAGMGDVLAGVVGSLMAQGLAPAVAGAVALYLSGRAAVLADLGPALTPGDVLEHFPAALAERGSGASELELPFVLFDQDPAR
jgi:NAD(P)H-hydrate epimerase